jgi:hypothetical protein
VEKGENLARSSEKSAESLCRRKSLLLTSDTADRGGEFFFVEFVIVTLS